MKLIRLFWHYSCFNFHYKKMKKCVDFKVPYDYHGQMCRFHHSKMT